MGTGELGQITAYRSVEEPALSLLAAHGVDVVANFPAALCAMILQSLENQKVRVVPHFISILVSDAALVAAQISSMRLNAH